MDQTPEDQSSNDPPGGSGSEGVPEQELLVVLAEASKLARELAVQLDGEQAAQPLDVAPILEHKSSKIEDQIDDLDVLLAATCDELCEVPFSPDDNLGWDGASSGENAGSSVPDFMDESLRADGASESSDASSESLPPAGVVGTPSVPFPQREPRPGVVGTGMVGVATAKEPTAQYRAEDELDGKASSRRRFDPRERFAQFAGVASSAAQRLLVLVFPVAERAVGLLEKGDRPMVRLSVPIRRVIGWLAIATLGTSVFVFFWSLM